MHIGIPRSTAQHINIVCGLLFADCVACWCLHHGCAAAAEGEDAVRAKLRAINEELVERFRTLEEEFR